MSKNQSNQLPYAYFKGKLIPFADAQVSIATNALHYGNAIFGGIKGYYQTNGSIGIFRLDDHITRLLNSAKILGYHFNMSPAQLSKIFIDLTKKNAPNQTVYYRPLIYRSDIRLAPDIDGEYDLAMYMLALEDYFDNNDGLNVCVSSWQRNSDNALPPRTKAAGGYVNAALAIRDAKAAGFDSAIMLDDSGHVSEGAVMNMFVVRGGNLVTSYVSADILEGITRQTVIDLAAQLKIPVVERPIDRTELYIADELFFCGTGTGLNWCRSVDKIEVSAQAGPIFNKLAAAYQKITVAPSRYLTLVK